MSEPKNPPSATGASGDSAVDPTARTVSLPGSAPAATGRDAGPTSAPVDRSSRTVATPAPLPVGSSTLAGPAASGPHAQARSLSDEALHRSLASLPGYEILNKIGEGGMGAVYRARQKALNRIVAIKVLSQRLGENAMYVARLNREAMVLAKISHPNVIACYDLGEHEGMRYVVMEYVEGEMLLRLIQDRKGLPQKEALYYLKQAVLGLDYANALGIIHRDIKPENMLLAKALATGTTIRLPVGFTLKIADLGLASFTSEGTENTRLTMEGSTLGSPHYMSPEQTVGEMDLDFRTDIYALGITLYHMLTGKTPYSAPSVGAVLAKKLSESIPDPRQDKPDLSPGVSLLIHKMTARKKEDRYATYGDLLQEIEAVEQDHPLLAEVLPDARASLSLLPDTIANLKRAPALPAPAAEASASAVSPTLSASNLACPPQPQYGRLVIALGFLAALVFAGIMVLRNPGTQPEPQPKAYPPVPHKEPDKVGNPKPAAPVPAYPGGLNTPGAAPAGAHDPVAKLPAPAAVKFEEHSLIENESTQGWTFAGDPKNFGFEDGSLFLQELDNWAFAERKLPAAEFELRVTLLVPVGANEAEVHLGVGSKEYVAFGLRWMANTKEMSAYVERRDAKTHAAIEKLEEAKGLNLNNAHKFRFSVWDKVALCKLNDKLLVAPHLPDDGAKNPLLRIAVRKGLVQFPNLDIAPRPDAK